MSPLCVGFNKKHTLVLRDKFNWLASISEFCVSPEFIHDKFVIKDTFTLETLTFGTFVIVLTFKLVIWALLTPNK